MSRAKNAAEAPAGLPQPAAILQAADEAVAEADQRLAELEAAVAAGDDSVELEHVEAARAQSTWARLRRKGADAKAARAAQARAEVRYDQLVEEMIPRAVVDYRARERELLEQAQELLLRLFDLNQERNTAVAIVAKYAADPTNFRRPDDSLLDVSSGDQVGSSAFEWRGERFEYRPTSDIATQLMRPLVARIRATSPGVLPAWLELRANHPIR